jgi:hypothetical protein
MSETIRPGGQISKDPADARVLVFDWSTWLGPDAALLDEGVFTVTSVSPRETPLTLEVDEVSLLAGGQAVQFRVLGGRRGTLYNIAHAIETTESPPQQQERSFFALVEDL